MSPFAALVEALEAQPVRERLAALARLPEVIEAATLAAMAEGQAEGLTWREIGEAWNGSSAQNAQQWYQRRTAHQIIG